MKIILSRKGFDSGYGGIPSPILPDGRMVSFPIPSRADRLTLADLNLPDIDVVGVIQDLSRGKYDLKTRIHLDPDLDRDKATRMAGWRPALGQTHIAQSHLKKMDIGPGDIFLFFGWFREVEKSNGQWHYVRQAPDMHVLFGWLEIDDVLPVVTDRESCLKRYPWIASHPHVTSPDHYTDSRNTLYIAPTQSRFCAHAAFGGGRFANFAKELRLTQPGASRTVWSLPSWFRPSDQRLPLTYHAKPSRWKLDGDRVTLQSVAKGQEFVLDCDYYPEANEWLAGLVEQNA